MNLTTQTALLDPQFGFAQKVTRHSSLCNLCVLCVSVVDEFRAKTHHRDTEDTEVAQRNPGTRTFSAKPVKPSSRRDVRVLRPGHRTCRAPAPAVGNWRCLNHCARGANKPVKTLALRQLPDRPGLIAAATNRRN